MRSLRITLTALATTAFAARALAQAPPPTTPAPGMPPPEASALVQGPKPFEAPKLDEMKGGVNMTLAAGGMLTTGNSRTLAMSVNGLMESRFGANGALASLLGNYGQGGPAGQPVQATAENLQARLRYDRYVLDEASLFLINTWRHDRFQGIDLRDNLDPGVKYIFWKRESSATWIEGGYDFQFDVRRNADRVLRDANGNDVLGANGEPVILSKTDTDHAARAFAGARLVFNPHTTLTAGVEYLQSFLYFTRYRVNVDGVLAAKIAGGLAVGLGFTMRFDHAPLPGKETLDTSTVVSLLYSFSSARPPAPATCAK